MKNNKNKGYQNDINKKQNENKSQNMPKSDDLKNKSFDKNVGSGTQKDYSSNQPKSGFQKNDNSFGKNMTDRKEQDQRNQKSQSDISKKNGFKK